MPCTSATKHSPFFFCLGALIRLVVTLVAIGKRATVSVFGGDYKTKDGTGVRDYLHVTDLAIGHVAALKKLLSTHIGCEVRRREGYGLYWC